MSLAQRGAKQLRLLWHLFLAPIRGDTHEARLESFYERQANVYDDSRSQLLHGRRELFASLDPPSGGVWVDMGAGTGQNVEFMSGGIDRLSSVYLVDLSPSLLAVAQRRSKANRWSNVRIVQSDVTQFILPAGSVDLVTFSYSLTMIPDWFVAIERAWEILRPGGTIGVVDFYVTRKFPAESFTRHGWSTRLFWQNWFALDNVNLSPDHMPLLCHKFNMTRLDECRGRAPWLPFLRLPFYIFIGKKAVGGLEA
jgi:S-adenosylmethionine-diacylgycerolhomoserine-N-methlytransferase